MCSNVHTAAHTFSFHVYILYGFLSARRRRRRRKQDDHD